MKPSNFKNNGLTNKERLKKFIEIFIINNRNLKRITKEGRTMGVFYKSYTVRNTNKKSTNFNKNNLEIDIIKLKNSTQKYIDKEKTKKNSSTLSSAIKRHEINLLILEFLQNILNNYTNSYTAVL